MEEPIYVLIVGHDLETKCNVANAFIRQRKGFKQFKCRRNLLVKKVVGTKATTVSGRTLYIALSPNINTPAWTYMTSGILGKYKTNIFVYVRSPGPFEVNDENSIETIKKTFRVTDVHVITHFQHLKDAEFANSGDVYIHKNMTFTERIIEVEKILSAVVKATKVKSLEVYHGQDEIGSSSAVGKKSSKAKGNKSTKDTGKKSTISIADRSIDSKSALPDSSCENLADERKEKIERQNTDELHLQEKIEAKDWDLFNRTLRYGRAKSNHVRVNIIGNQGAGKTTLVSRLHDLDVVCPDANQKPTEALEIKELSSRCTEVGEEKVWETNRSDGYTDDLNIQRMAQAMKIVQRYLDGNVCATSTNITVETFDTIDEAQFGSYVEDDIKVTTQQPYSAINTEQSRIHYMKQILRKKNHSQGERMYISYWDFAGQSTYYSTHQVFMSPSAVYVLVVDLSVDFNEKMSDSLKFRTGVIKDCSVAESLVFWISSIKAFTSDIEGGNAPVVIVGTHIDKIKKNASDKGFNPKDVIRSKFDNVREILKMSEVECIGIDNADPNRSDLVALRNRILELGLGVIDEEIPAQWIDLERRIQEKRVKGTRFMSFEELLQLNKDMDVPIKENGRIEAFLCHQHNRGHLIYFYHDNLRDLIILEPDILAKFLNTLMRKGNKAQGMKQNISMHNHNGMINRRYVIETASMMTEYPEVKGNVDKLLDILVHLSVIRPYKHKDEDKRYLLPCLLPDKPQGNQRKPGKETKYFQIVFQNNHMPPTFYHILVGGLLNEWTPIEKTIGSPEMYNLYACFRLGTEIHQMETYWKESCVYIDIQNYSMEKHLTTEQIFKILDIVEKRIAGIFQVYKHTNTNYEIRVLCPHHDHSYVSLSTLKIEGNAMCYHENNDHAVGFEEVFGQKLLAKRIPDCYKRKPTDKDIGRLGRYLAKENTLSLACRIRMSNGFIESDWASQGCFDENHRRVYILQRWRGNNAQKTLGELIDLLTVTQDYPKGDLVNLLEGCPETRNYDITKEKLDNIPGNKCDILAAADSVGALYPVLMLELGLHYTEIEVVRANKQNDMRAIIFTLLEQWRQKCPNECTTRTLLDTAFHVGIDTTKIQQRVKLS